MSATPVPANGQVKRRGRPFENGNPGRKPGSKNKSTLIAMSLLEGEAESLAGKVVQLANGGDKDMLKFALGRVLPRERAVSLELPPVHCAADAVKAQAVIANAIATGEVTPSEAAALGSFIASCVRTVDTAELEERLSTVEEVLKTGTK